MTTSNESGVVDAEAFFRQHGTGSKSLSAVPESDPPAEPSKPVIEFLSPSECADWDMPEGYVLVGDMDIVRESWFVIGGTQGVGKSRLINHLGVCGATGQPWMGLQVHTNFKTLVIQSENGRARLRQEMEALRRTVREAYGVNIDDYLRVSPPPDYGLNFGDLKFSDAVKGFIQEFGPSVVVIDPWNKVAMDDKGKDYRQAFDRINATCWVGGLKPAIGVVAHLRKPSANDRPGRDGMHRFSGHHILTSAPRSAYILDAATSDVTDDRVVFSPCKNNDGMMKAPSAWTRSDSGYRECLDIDWDEFYSQWGEGGKGGRPSTHADKDYLALVPPEGITHGNFVEKAVGALGVSQRTARRTLKRLASGDAPALEQTNLFGDNQTVETRYRLASEARDA